MGLIKKGLLFIFSIYALITFIIVMLLVFPFAMLAATAGKIRGGNWVYLCCRVWAQLWYYTIGVVHEEIYEHPHDTSRQYIFVANHISYMEIGRAHV